MIRISPEPKFFPALHNLTQGSIRVEKYTMELEKILIKCDVQEIEDQPLEENSGGLDPKYTHVVELSQYSTFEEVCILGHKVE